MVLLQSFKARPISNSKDIFKENKCVIVVPTYNNGTTILNVVEEIKQYAEDILVVNDGSTDNTSTIVSDITNIEVLSHKTNQGKGKAIRSAFKWALQNNFDYIITIDSDAQHFPADLVGFADELENTKETLILGARNLSEEQNINGKSSFANKFSNFWTWVETGYRLPDTQTGFRLYPVKMLKGTNWITKKYEFEIEVLVRSAWKGIEIKSIPIQVFYPKPEDRISHFRPLKDFTRITILNTVLVTLALLFFRPLMIYRNLKKKSWKQILKDEIFKTEESNLKKAISIGFGVFMGIFPIWGYQLAVCIPLAIFLKLNKALVVIAAHISIPPMIPIILYASFVIGGWLIGNDMPIESFDFSLNIETFKVNMKQYLVGAVFLASVAGLIFGVLSYFLLTVFNKNPQQA